MSIKFIPFYYPQFHEIPENDAWWGEGFTDWDRVKKAKPLFKEHYQPRIPKNGYYDLSDISSIEQQIQLAEQYNLYGFNFYHYWFDGKLLLEKPLDNFLQQKTNFKFCITWANETWTKRWIGKVNDILIEQKHSNDLNIWNAHLDYLERLFKDRRYITINNEPLFLIYRPDLITDLQKMIGFYNERIKKSLGFKIYWMGIKAYESLSNKWENHVDGILKFEPRYSMTTQNNNRVVKTVDQLLRSLPERMQIPIGELKARLNNSYQVLDYKKICDNIIERNKCSSDAFTKIYQSVFVDWDNTARYGKRAKVFINSNPENFYHLVKSVVKTELDKSHEYIFVNAWNEWSECAYLEPDIIYDDAYLKILKDISKVS